jgi:TrmH family RNA methyltransferase
VSVGGGRNERSRAPAGRRRGSTGVGAPGAADVRLSDVARARRDGGLAVLEGFHALKHATRFGAELLGAWTADPEELEALRARLAPDIAIEAEGVTAEELAAVVPRAQVVAVARRPRLPHPDVLVAERGTAPLVLLEDPRHLGNLGAAVRVAAAAGAGGLLTTGRQDPWHADALRGAAGLHFALPVYRLKAIPAGPRPLLALDPEGERFDPRAVPPGAILAFGTERDGLTDALLDRADGRLALPMAPGVSSLNLATAVSATLFALSLLT